MSEVPFFKTIEGREFYVTVRKALAGAVEQLKVLNKNLEALTAAVRELSSKRGDA